MSNSEKAEHTYNLLKMNYFGTTNFICKWQIQETVCLKEKVRKITEVKQKQKVCWLAVYFLSLKSLESG